MDDVPETLEAIRLMEAYAEAYHILKAWKKQVDKKREGSVDIRKQGEGQTRLEK